MSQEDLTTPPGEIQIVHPQTALLVKQFPQMLLTHLPSLDKGKVLNQSLRHIEWHDTDSLQIVYSIKPRREECHKENVYCLSLCMYLFICNVDVILIFCGHSIFPHRPDFNLILSTSC